MDNIIKSIGVICGLVFIDKKTNYKNYINGSYYGHVINPKTKSTDKIYVTAPTKDKAYLKILKLKKPYQEIFHIEEIQIIKYKAKKTLSDEKKYKLIQDLQDYFGGKKYNIIDQNTILRIADHSKNPKNDGKYNYDNRVISFVLPAYGGKFTGYNSNEYNLEGLNKAQSIKLIKSKLGIM